MGVNSLPVSDEFISVPNERQDNSSGTLPDTPSVEDPLSGTADRAVSTGQFGIVRGFIRLVFLLAFVPSLATLLPRLLDWFQGLIADRTGMRPIPGYVLDRLDILRGYEAFGWVGLAILIAYLVSLLSGVLLGLLQKADHPSASPTAISSRDPFYLLLAGLFSIAETLFCFLAVLTGGINQAADGLLDSIEKLVSYLEWFFTSKYPRIFFAGGFSLLSMAWLWFTLYFTSQYLLAPDVLRVLQMTGSIGMAFLCQCGAVMTLRQVPFRKLALAHFWLLGAGICFALPIGLVIYAGLTAFNTFLNSGPIFYTFLALFTTLFLVELGRRWQK